MQLTVRDVAALLNISKKTVYRWIKLGKLPTYRIEDQYRFNRAELLEWAIERRIEISPAVLDEPQVQKNTVPSLFDALEQGGILYRLAGSTKQEVFASLVQSMKLPTGIDQDSLVNALLVREELASTGIGQGVAIPHVRGPVVMRIEEPLLVLGFLDRPIEFMAIDKQPVQALFFLICPTVRLHLQMLSRLSFALQDPDLMKAVHTQALRQDIMSEVRRVEQKFDSEVSL